jgi:ATP-dependent 26S proteasome regulatory subunit
MFKKTAVEQISQDEQVKAREKIEIMRHKLQTLKNKSSELRQKCEELRNTLSEDEGKVLICSKCGDAIESGQEVMIKDSTGTKKRYYHKECFQDLTRALSTFLFLNG